MRRETVFVIAASVVTMGMVDAVDSILRRRRSARAPSPLQIAQRYQPAPGRVRVLAGGRVADAPPRSVAAARTLLRAADEHDLVPAAALARAGIYADGSMHLRAALRRLGAQLVTREDV